jgi:hypothetical protein
MMVIVMKWAKFRSWVVHQILYGPVVVCAKGMESSPIRMVNFFGRASYK